MTASTLTQTDPAARQPLDASDLVRLMIGGPTAFAGSYPPDLARRPRVASAQSLRDRIAGWYARLGRQAGGSAGLMGTFDGMQAGYERYVAQGPNCGDYSSDDAANSRNTAHTNFGCAYQSNLAAMVANPEDLLHGQGPHPHGSELDRQREPVEVAANLGYCRGIVRTCGRR